MKVVITERFEKKYLEKLSKHFNKVELADFLKERTHTFISLHHPFFKLKNKINNFAFRGILAVIKDERIIPLLMFPKKDKKYGGNINWRDNKNLIGFEYDKAIEDIRNKKFEEI